MMSHLTSGIDAEQIANWLQRLVEPDSTVEMRVIYSGRPPHVRHYATTDLLMMARDALRLGNGAAGVYWVMNPLPADWCGSPAKDVDIARRRWMLVDCDPRRKGTISATDAEKEAARRKMIDVDAFLAERGWSPPIVADSGNGWHLLYRIDLPGDDQELVVQVLRTLDRQFSDAEVHVDTTVGNASRVCKLYGTFARKGENTPQRPHRVSQIVTFPDELEIVPTEFLQQLIDDCGDTPVSDKVLPVAPQSPLTSRTAYPEAVQHARNYLAKMDPSISGEHGHDRLLRAASVLINDFLLSDDEAFDLLATEFNPRCVPPWEDADIRRKIAESKKKPPNRPLKGQEAINDSSRPAGSASSDAAPPNETTVIVDEPWPDPIDDAAFYGVAGDIVRKIAPHTEADSVAILIQTLVAAGNVIGRHCYFRVEATRHYPNLFAVLVGSSSSGRKGTSGDQVNRVIQQLDENWFLQCVLGGLVSGEGLIWQVRDPMTKQEPIREGGKKDGKVIDYQDVIVDEGVSDKRLLAYETEFSALLKAKSREKNSLSEVLRQAWDCGYLRTAAKNSPAKATNAHVSLIGHITPGELREVSSEVDMVNGLANRFLWCCVRRSKLLPEGGEVHRVDFELEVTKLKVAVEFAAVEREVVRDAQAANEWRQLYPALTAERPGAVGAVCNRGAAQVVRLSLLYALLDMSPAITIDHLRAALALWHYCEASVKHVFGHSLANRTADTILHALKGARENGLSRTAISNLFARNKSKPEIDAALQVLFSAKLARFQSIPTNGRSVETWFATA